MPAELFPQYCTIEYAMPRMGPAAPPSFVFVLDTTVRCRRFGERADAAEWHMSAAVVCGGHSISA